MAAEENPTYQEIYDSFIWDRPTHFNFANDVIDKWASKDKKKPAIFWVDDKGNEKSRTFTDISTHSKKISNALSTSGVERGDVVIVILGREIEWWEIFTAVLRMGAVISPGTTQLSAKDVEYRFNAAKATCIVTNFANAAKVDEIAENCPTLKTKVLIDGSVDGWLNYSDLLTQFSDDFPDIKTAADEESMCYFTSGTTGYPKMTIHTHSYAIAHQVTGPYWLNLGEND